MQPTIDQIAYSVNVSWVFPELPFCDRLRAVAQAGFDTIEFGFPSQADIAALETARNQFGLKIDNFNQDVPVWDLQNRGYLVDPARRSEFRKTLDQALEIGSRLEARKIMLPAGNEVHGLSRARQRDFMLENLGYAAHLAKQAGILLTIEVLNPTDNPGYFLTSSSEAFEIIQEVNNPQVKFQFDTYHLQMMEGDLPLKIRTYAGSIGHFQFADYPGRHEPGTGQIDFEAILTAMREIGYQGTVGLEFRPLAQGADALAWVPQTNRKRIIPAQNMDES
jgi:hydroxypyruvate isomerase